jgi:cytochrome P450
MPTDQLASSPVALDLSRPELWSDGSVAGLFERLRREDPVHFCADSAFGPYWSVTRYRDIIEVEALPDLYSSSFRHGGITLYGGKPLWFPMFIAMDGEEHKAQRRSVAPAFAPSQMLRLAPLLRTRTEEVVDGLPVGETFDWADLVSTELTSQMLAMLFDFPWEERRRLTRWADSGGDVHAPLDQERARKQLETLWECAGWFLRLWKAREKDGSGSDLVSMMARSDATRSMTPPQYLGNLILLIVGGSDTTRSTMSALPAVNRLWPEEWEKLASDPFLIPGAAQELIRWQTPLAHMRRTATRDCELAGRRISAGEKVVLWYLSGNRDESVFVEPDRFLCDRADARRHLAFGFGVHRCVGARLAELQVATLIEVLIERRLRPVQSGEAARNPNCFSHGYRTMPVTLLRT